MILLNLILIFLCGIQFVDSSFISTTYSNTKSYIDGMKSRLIILSSTSSIQSTRTCIQPKHKNIRAVTMICQRINNKRCELQATTKYIKRDIIIGNTSWLAPEYANCEILQEGFNSKAYRKDRNKNGSSNLQHTQINDTGYLLHVYCPFFENRRYVCITPVTG